VTEMPPRNCMHSGSRCELTCMPSNRPWAPKEQLRTPVLSSCLETGAVVVTAERITPLTLS
jgi:hypothetical protein